MTDLTKKITRRVKILTDNRIAARQRDLVAVSLYPDGTIGFRPYKKRREVRLPLGTVYVLAMREAANAERREKARKRKGLL